MTDIPDQLVTSLVSAMEQQGIATLPSFLHASELRALQQFVASRVDTCGEQAGFSGPHTAGGTLLGDLAKTPVFLTLLRKVYETGIGRPAPDQKIFQVMRCLKGRSGLKHSLIFHYDSYFLTALLPIVIPEGPASGHLVIRPNTRPFRASYLHNLLDKIRLDNPLSQRSLARRWRHEKLTEIAMQPGHLYLFWGYRTVHANAPCDPQKLRATALFHFGDPYAHNSVRHALRRIKTLLNR